MGRYNYNGVWYHSGRLVSPTDARRHRAKCIHSLYVCKKYYCNIYGEECRGSSFCKNYKVEKPKKLILNEKVCRGRSYVSKVGIFAPKQLRKPGTAVKHKFFGYGTVVSCNCESVTVDFFKDGEKFRKNLFIDVCLGNGVLSIYDYK